MTTMDGLQIVFLMLAAVAATLAVMSGNVIAVIWIGTASLWSISTWMWRKRS